MHPMSLVLAYLIPLRLSEGYRDMEYHTASLDCVLCNIRTKPGSMHIQHAVEGSVNFTLSLNVFSNNLRSSVASVDFQLRIFTKTLRYLIVQMPCSQLIYIHGHD